MAQDKAPAAFKTDRSARPRHPVESTVLRMGAMGAGNGVTSSGPLCGGHLRAEVPTGCDWRGGAPKKQPPGGMPRIGCRRGGVLKGKVVSQRQRAKTQDRESLTAAWHEIPWSKVHRHVFRLQQRINQAPQRGDVRTVRQRQNLLSKSWYARL